MDAIRDLKAYQAITRIHVVMGVSPPTQQNFDLRRAAASLLVERRQRTGLPSDRTARTAIAAKSRWSKQLKPEGAARAREPWTGADDEQLTKLVEHAPS